MSAGYASRLREYPNKGVCGLPELSDTKRSLAAKIRALADLVKQSNKCVFLTGAGISTSAGIPDFRGPKGIWTLEQKEETLPKRKRKRTSCDDVEKSAEGADFNFASAKPSATHHIITKLIADDVFQFCITQNVDGLHRRSGLPREKMAILHGCAFTEKCEDCSAEHFLEKEVGPFISSQKTGRKCTLCGGDLRDTLLDWEDPLPEDDFEKATIICETSDLSVCLGTSLRIEPAGSLPFLAQKSVIVNLQETPYDQKASLVIRGRVDEVMNGLMNHLGKGDWEDNYTAPIIQVVSGGRRQLA